MRKYAVWITVGSFLLLAILALESTQPSNPPEYATNTFQGSTTLLYTKYTPITIDDYSAVTTLSRVPFTAINNNAVYGPSEGGYAITAYLYGAGGSLCRTWGLSARLQSGNQLGMVIRANLPISLYVIDNASYAGWVRSGKCSAVNTLEAVTGFTSYRLNWIVPDNGAYDFLFVNYNAGTVMITMDLSGMVTTITHTYTHPYLGVKNVTYLATETGFSSQVTRVVMFQEHPALILAFGVTATAVAFMPHVLIRIYKTRRAHRSKT